MKRKVLLVITIIFSIFFIGISNVNAEEYQVGDLVEIINPSGGSNARFYYIGKYKSDVYVSPNPYYIDDDIFLIMTNPAVSNKTYSEYINSVINDDYLSVINDNYKYIKDMSQVKFVTDELEYAFSFMISNMQNEDDSVLYSMAKKLNNGFYLYHNQCTNCDYEISYIDTSDNTNSITKKLTFANDEELDNDTTKLNYYYMFKISKENESIIRKVSDSSNKSETKTINSSVQTITQENNKISNPKTSDMNVYIALLVIGLFIGVITVSAKRIKKLNKVSR